MPITLKTADGARITVPDDISESEANAVLDHHEGEVRRASQRQAFDSGDADEQFGVGIAKPVVKTYLGLKDLAGKVGLGGGLTDEDKANIERLGQTHGPHAFAGDVAGNVAMLAAPGGVGARVAAKVGTMLPSALARLAPAAADVAVNSGMGALQAPEDGESRLGNATGAGTGTLVGRGLGRVLTKVISPMRGATPEAQALLDQGVPLTPGQAGGGAARYVEGRMAGIPWVGDTVKARQGEAVRQWNKNTLNEIIPDGEVSDAGHFGFREMKQKFDDAYKELWDRDLQMADGTVMSGARASELDDTLRKAAVDSTRRGEMQAAQAANEERAQFRANLPKEVNEQLTAIDGLYRQFATTQKAASYKPAAKEGGVFTPDQLLAASIAKDKSAGKAATAQGRGVLQQEATDAGKVLNVDDGLGLAGSMGLGYGLIHAPGALAMAPVLKAAYSKPVQNFWRNGYPQGLALAAALRKRGVTAGTLGASVEDAE